MFRLMRMPDGNALLIRERDMEPAGIIHESHVEAVSQALGIGVPVIVGIGDGKSTTFQCSHEVDSIEADSELVAEVTE